MAGYELRHPVTADGGTWTVCLKLHVVAPLTPMTQRVRLFPSATVSIWPPPLDAKKQRALHASGWYEHVRNAMVALGYDGDWRLMNGARWGDFLKPIRGLAEFKREMKNLEKFPVYRIIGNPLKFKRQEV